MVSLGVCNGGALKMITLYKCVVLGKLTYISRGPTWLDNKSLSSSLNESQKTYALCVIECQVLDWNRTFISLSIRPPLILFSSVQPFFFS